MLKSITRILPFFIVTLLCIGGVELFYGMAERYLIVPQQEGTSDEPVSPAGRQKSAALEKHSNFNVILERNLFQSYLKQPEPAVSVKENPLEGLEATTLDLVLMGTITGREGRSRAIILEKAKRKQEIYYPGDVVQGAEIKEILRGKVILNYQGKDEILDMSEASKVKPSAAAAAVSPASRKTRVVEPQVRPRRRVIPRNIRTRRPVPIEENQDNHNELQPLEEVQDEEVAEEEAAEEAAEDQAEEAGSEEAEVEPETDEQPDANN